MQFVVRPPDPKEIARDSHGFFLAAVGRSESDVDSACARLEDAQTAYSEILNPTWNDERVLAKAEENFDRAEAHHRANLLKLNWESNNQWRSKIITSVQYTKSLLASVDWKHIFRARHN